MTSERWQQINRIYDAALEVAEGARPAFLESNCQGDEELRREVESLLAYDQQAQQLLDRPAMQMAAEKLAGEPPSLVGRQLGPYQIQVVLGVGGMGEVYKAKDTRLNRYNAQIFEWFGWQSNAPHVRVSAASPPGLTKGAAEL